MMTEEAWDSFLVWVDALVRVEDMKVQKQILVFVDEADLPGGFGKPGNDLAGYLNLKEQSGAETLVQVGQIIYAMEQDPNGVPDVDAYDYLIGCPKDMWIRLG